MARYITSSDDAPVRVAVAPARPCPVCGATAGCGVAAEDGFVLCARVASPQPVDAGGWLHGPGRLAGPGEATGAPAGPVLVVEDDEVLGELIRLVLEDEGYAVVCCRSAGDALRTIRALRPRAVVLDLMLPDGRGEGLLRRFKADPATFAAPVVVLSAAARELGPDEAQRAHAVLDKPFDVEALLTALAGAAPR